MTQKLPQICTIILRIPIGKVAWLTVYICGNFWATQYIISGSKCDICVGCPSNKWRYLSPCWAIMTGFGQTNFFWYCMNQTLSHIFLTEFWNNYYSKVSGSAFWSNLNICHRSFAEYSYGKNWNFGKSFQADFFAE